jgi:hypothetical protein
MTALPASAMFVWMQMVCPFNLADRMIYRPTFEDNEVGTSGKTFNPEFPVNYLSLVRIFCSNLTLDL